MKMNHRSKGDAMSENAIQSLIVSGFFAIVIVMGAIVGIIALLLNHKSNKKD